MKKMRLKKRIKINYKISLLILLMFGIIFNINLPNLQLNSNEKFINKILKKSNSHLIKEESNLIFGNSFNFINISMKQPISIIDKVFAYEKQEREVQTFSYIQNLIVDNPRVYIYNTHPKEQYLGEEKYELGNNVLQASILLQEELNKLGIPTIVEERNATQYINENNLNFDDSYIATRTFLEDKLKKYNFDLIIDLHRDAVSETLTTTTIDGKEYAKIMFVNNINYEENVAIANKLNDIIKNKNESLTRGIYKKYVDNFNQDLNSNVILLELGGNYNKMEEVENTIKILAESIKELLK